MPLYDNAGHETDEVVVELPQGIDVRRVIVRHAEVSFYDADGREALLVQRPSHPGAGLDVQFADHVVVNHAP